MFNCSVKIWRFQGHYFEDIGDEKESAAHMSKKKGDKMSIFFKWLYIARIFVYITKIRVPYDWAPIPMYNFHSGFRAKILKKKEKKNSSNEGSAIITSILPLEPVLESKTMGHDVFGLEHGSEVILAGFEPRSISFLIVRRFRLSYWSHSVDWETFSLMTEKNHSKFKQILQKKNM
jgi:hypothetical protein